MPTYEYRCDTCDRNFDVVQSFHDEALAACPTCESPVRRVFGSVGIVFKGSGFYKTDSRTSAGAKPADGASASRTDGSGGDGAGGDGTSGDGSTDGGASKDRKTSSGDSPTPPGKSGNDAGSGSPSGGAKANGKTSGPKESVKS